MKLGRYQTNNTRNLIQPDTKICALCYSVAKGGKTTFSATLDKLTRWQSDKPSIIVAVEESDGGGTMSVAGAEIEFFQPRSYNDLQEIIPLLYEDTQFGGVIFDSSTEYVNLHLKPFVLAQPNRKVSGEEAALRAMGVPAQSDYQTMGEQARKDFSRLIRMTYHPDPNKRKHLVVTALQREKNDRDTGRLIRVGPDLPGAMMDTATAMFQTVMGIQLRTEVARDPTNPKAPTSRVQVRKMKTTPTYEFEVLGDRTGCFPDGAPLNLLECWKEFWVPRFEKKEG